MSRDFAFPLDINYPFVVVRLSADIQKRRGLDLYGPYYNRAESLSPMDGRIRREPAGTNPFATRTKRDELECYTPAC